MANELIFILACVGLVGITAIMRHLGAAALISWQVTQAVFANLFVLKQITLLGIEASASDVYAVSAMVTLWWLQRLHGTPAALNAMRVTLVTLIAFAFVSVVQLSLAPSPHDLHHGAYQTLLSPNLRLVLASLVAMMTAQRLEIYLNQWGLSQAWFKRLPGALQMGSVLMLTQAIDTALFAAIGLYGILTPLWPIAIMGYGAKLLAVMCFMCLQYGSFRRYVTH